MYDLIFYTVSCFLKKTSMKLIVIFMYIRLLILDQYSQKLNYFCSKTFLLVFTSNLIHLY